MELLSKRELHGQNPIVAPCNKQSLSQFEMQSRKSKHSKSNSSAIIQRRGMQIFVLKKTTMYFCPRAGTQSGQMSGEGKAGPPGGGRAGFPMGSRGSRGRFPGPPGGPGGDRFPGGVGPGGPPPHFPGQLVRRILLFKKFFHCFFNTNEICCVKLERSFLWCPEGFLLLLFILFKLPILPGCLHASSRRELISRPASEVAGASRCPAAKRDE